MKQQVGLIFTSYLLTMAWVRVAYTNTQFEIFALISLCIYICLSIYLWKKSNARLTASLSISSIALLIFLYSRFEIENILGILMVQGLLSVYLGILSKSKLTQIIGAIIYLNSAFATFLNMFDEIQSIEFLNWNILLLLVVGLNQYIPLFTWIKDNKREKTRTVIYLAFMLLLLVYITLTVDALTKNFSDNIQFMSVSFSWALYAFILIIIGSHKNIKLLRILGLLLLFITLGKLIFIDLHFISILIRAVLFIGLGIIGILGSRTFYKTAHTKDRNN